MSFHAVVFAGGVGQRLWPLSRKNSPKQFSPLIGEKSSIQQAVERLRQVTAPEKIFVGTNQRYKNILLEQLPEIPEHNFILEPARRDVGAAVALAFFTLQREGVTGPVIFQWSDHYVTQAQTLIDFFQRAGELLSQDDRRIIVIGQKPRFANDNLGWIKVEQEKGRIGNEPYYTFGEWRYRPPPAACRQMFADSEAEGTWVWNTGHFVSTVEFVTESFLTLSAQSRELALGVNEIVSYRGTPIQQQKLDELYPKLPMLSFDDVFLKAVPREQALLFSGQLGWVDPGNLYALKEALQAAQQDTVARGKVVHLRASDSFIVNTTERPVVALGVSGLILVEMPDVTLLVDKNSVRQLGDVLRELERDPELKPLL